MESKHYFETKFIYNNLFNGFMDEFKISPKSNAAEKLGQLCKAAFLFGREYGKEEYIENVRLFNERDEDEHERIDKENPSHKAAEALTVLLELYARKELMFKDRAEARKYADRLRAYVKYNRLNLKFAQEGNKITLKESKE